MKKIVPFNNVLTFSTAVKEITAISLEHNINKECDLISGEFYISGEYKITDGQLEREKFNFELPFDIALSNNYILETLVVDIDDFRYELLDDKNLKVNIDLYLDGEVDIEPVKRIIEDPLEYQSSEDSAEDLRTEEETYEEEYDKYVSEESQKTSIPLKEEFPDDNVLISTDDEEEKLPSEPIERKIELLDEMLTNDKENMMKEETTNSNININNEVNIFKGFDEEESYVTYRVYRVMEIDTIDKILEKYNITKEKLAQYNNIEDIKPGDKLIIPTDDK